MNIKKISLLLLLILVLSFTFNIYISNASYADKMKTLIGGGEAGIADVDSAASEKASTALSVIITIVRIVGVCVAIVMLLAVAMKYMTAAAGEKAEIKKSAVQYVVGAVVLFGAVGILGIINDFAKNIKLGGS